MNFSGVGLLTPLARLLKRILFRPGVKYRRVKFGIASGLVMPIDRRANIRPETGLFERAVAEYFKSMARAAKIGYDIGANDGYYTLAMCKSGISLVYSFEPEIELSERLSSTLELNGFQDRVTLLREWVGDGAGATRCIDELLEENMLHPPDLLKMDIDGGELAALRGMQETLRLHAPDLIIEVHSVQLEEDCRELLRQSGYRVAAVDSGTLLRFFLPETRTAPGIAHNRWLVATRP